MVDAIVMMDCMDNYHYTSTLTAFDNEETTTGSCTTAIYATKV